MSAIPAPGNQSPAIQTPPPSGDAGSTNSATETPSLGDLYNTYGRKVVDQALVNYVANVVSAETKGRIANSDLPQSIKDEAAEKVDEVATGFRTVVAPDIQNAVNQAVENDPATSKSLDLMKLAMQDAMDEASSDASNMGRGKGNWLALLARALGATAGKHLAKMVELGEQMGSLDSKENPEEFAKTQAEFQAEAQIFKLFNEAISTMVKSIGEALSSVARKQ